MHQAADREARERSRTDAVAHRLRRLAAGIRSQVRRDLEAGRGFLWWPVALGLSAAIYFALPFEPALWMAVAPFVVAVAAAVLARVRLGRVPVTLALAAAAATGFLAAKVEVEAARAPSLVTARAATLTGLVEAVEDRGTRGHRLRIRLEAMDPPPREGLPRLARVTLRGASSPPKPGARIRLRARVGPPQAAVYPGGYDFARAAFFAGVGASGFALGAPEPVGAGQEEGGGWPAAVERFRLSVSAAIREELPGDAGAIAAALIVGDRGAIHPETDEAMRVSGLSHVLSISGLHMALVAACLYGGLRALLAAVPRLALSLPIKAMAAAVALAGTLGYLVIAGLGLATQRSAVMIALTLMAVILGRRAFSLRGVAVAALIVFGLQPHAVLDPGAQLSFAAVTALIAGYEAVMARRAPPGDGGDVSRLVRIAVASARWIGLSMLTSLVAGLATAPIALHHFNRAAPLGLVANLVAMPLVSFVIMPAGLVAALAMPLGLAAVPLAIMGWGIEAMVAVAEVVAEWTPGGGVLGRPAVPATLLMVAGGLWLCLWSGSVRLAGVPVIVLGLLMAPAGRAPDLVVAGDGRRALVRLPEGAWALLGRPDDFETAIWLAALGDPRPPGDASLVAATSCDPSACILKDGGRVVASLVFHPSAFGDECPEAGLVVAAVTAPAWCRGMTTVLDPTDLQGTGTRTFAVERPAAGGGWRLAELGRAIPDPRRPFDIGAP